MSRVRREVLANGLSVLVQEIRTAPLVSVWSWYRVGSRDEGPGRTGVVSMVVVGLVSGEVSARLPGYLVPRLVREVAGAPAKLPL